MARPEHILDDENDLRDVLQSNVDALAVRRDVVSRDIVVWDQAAGDSTDVISLKVRTGANTSQDV